MAKANLSDKIRLRNELKLEIYKSNVIDRVKKCNLEQLMVNLINNCNTLEELDKTKDYILIEVGAKRKEEVKEVADKLSSAKNVEGTNINNVNTLNRENGTVITSFKTNDGSIYVKDSTYSGDINKIVSDVSTVNPDLNKSQLTTEAFNEMQRRQIDIPVVPINNSNLNENVKKQYEGVGDNKLVNTEYQILVDERNRLYDLQKNNKEAIDNNDNNQSYGEENNMIKEKPKVKVKSIPGMKFDDSAFVDALLLGNITLYTGILGLCAIFSKM